MTKTTQSIEKKDYNLLGDLDNEQDAVNSFSDHSTGYVCDVISEIADGFIPIYTHDIWEDASRIKDHIEEAIASGVAVFGEGANLESIFQSGYYMYYSQSLYNNLERMVYNYIVDIVNAYLEVVEQPVDLEAIEQAIEDETEDYNNNNLMDNIIEIAQDITSKIKDGEFNK